MQADLRLADLIPELAPDATAIPIRVAALDGLRACAVVAVVVYHLDLSIGSTRFAPGGFLGVDLFFVLSGYLIGSVALDEIRRTGTFSLLGFWSHRFRRLMPATFLVLGVVLVIAVTIGWERNVSRDLVAGLLWFENWHLIATDQPYVDQFTDPSPLRHLWSVSIGGQWFLLFPLLAFGCRRWLLDRRVLAGVVVAFAALASVIAMAAIYGAADDPWRAYFGTDARIFALLFGCAAAFFPATESSLAPAGERRRWAGLLVAGMLGWLVLVVTADESSGWMYRGGFLVASVCSLAAVVGAAKSRVRWFDHGVVQWLGTRSYGIYLWHWVAIVFVTPERLGTDGPLLVLVRCVITGVAAEITYRWVELPMREVHRVRPGFVVPVGLVCSLMLGVVVVASPITGDAGGPAVVRTGARGSQILSGQVDGLGVHVVGDSVSSGVARLPGGVDPDGEGRIGLLNGAEPGCGLSRLPRPDPASLTGDALEECLEMSSTWRAQLQLADLDVVVWVMGPFDSVDVLDAGDDLLVAGSEPWRELVRERIDESLDVLADSGLPLVAVLPPCRDTGEVASMPSLTGDGIDALVEIVTGLADEHDLTLVDPSPWQCPPDGPANVTLDGQAILDDGLHYTAAGKQAFWAWLTPQLRELASAPSG